VPKMYLL